MTEESIEDKKTEVLARIERLRELIEEDAPELVTERAYEEILRTMGALYRRSEGDSPVNASSGESPPSL